MELASFVEGPLLNALRDRADPSYTRQILRAIGDILATAAAPTQTHRVPRNWANEETVSVSVLDAPVPVLIIAGGARLAVRLNTALGPDRIHVRSKGTRTAIEDALPDGVLVVIVDATDVPPIRPEDLLDVLQGAALDMTLVVWGDDLAYGRRVLEISRRVNRRCSGLHLADGMESLLDLILSRRMATAVDRGGQDPRDPA
jgi:hypothetical protein